MAVADLFFLFSAVLGSGIIIIYLAIASNKFTRGNMRNMVELLMFGYLFSYGFMALSISVELLKIEDPRIIFVKNSFVLISFALFLFAANEIYELSKVLGFHSEKISKKLKKILKS